MIKRIERKKNHRGAKYDPKKTVYVSYKVDFYAGGRKRESGFGSRKEAQDFIDAARRKQKQKKLGIKEVVKSPRVSALFTARIAAIRHHAEKVRAQRIFAQFSDLLPGDPKVTEITRGDLQTFLNVRIEQVKAETVNREINLLSKAFRSAPELFPRDLEDYEPPKIPRPKFKRKRREKIISEKEKCLILTQLYAEQGDETLAEHQNRIRIGRMFHIAYLLGMAYKEVAHLLRAAYNGEQLNFIREKSETPITFEWLPDEAHQVIREAIKDSNTEYIFTHSGSTPKNFYKIMRAAVESAGLTYGRNQGITFHSARHSFVTTAMQHGDLKTVGSMSGHSDSTMVMLYTHATAESRKRLLKSMYGKIDLRDIFDRVKADQMSFEEFEKAVS